MYVSILLDTWFTIVYMSAFVLFAEAVIFLLIAALRQLPLWRQLFSVLPFGAALLTILSSNDDLQQVYPFYRRGVRILLLSSSTYSLFQISLLPFVLLALVFPILGCILCSTSRKP